MARIVEVVFDVTEEEHLELQKIAMKKLAENIINKFTPMEVDQIIQGLKNS